MIKLPKITEASIDLSTICQLHCVECSTSKGITHAGIVGKGQLSFEDFSNFIDTNPEIKRIEMSNWGEIFLNKDIVKILEYAFRKGVTLIAETVLISTMFRKKHWKHWSNIELSI